MLDVLDEMVQGRLLGALAGVLITLELVVMVIAMRRPRDFAVYGPFARRLVDLRRAGKPVIVMIERTLRTLRTLRTSR